MIKACQTVKAELIKLLLLPVTLESLPYRVFPTQQASLLLFLATKRDRFRCFLRHFTDISPPPPLSLFQRREAGSG